MFHHLSARLPAAAALIVLLLVPAGCSLNRDLGGDPCLLQQYQGRSYGTIHTIQGALGTLTNSADALSPQQGTINASQDISETLTSVAEFQLRLDEQWQGVIMGALPPEGATFRATIHAAIERLDTGSQLLTQAYVDAANGDTRAATAIVTAARDDMRQGRLLLAQANVQAAKLATYNPNC